VQDFLTWFNATFSGQTTIEDITAEGDTVVVRGTFHVTQKSEWNGRPPGHEVTFTGITTYLIADGKVVESWHKHLTW
jgi:predicted ester cyclase